MSGGLRGWKLGDAVCVHGQGFGNIVELGDRKEYPGPYAVVELGRSDYHEPSGKRIDWTEHKTVLLDSYPRQMSRSSR